MGKVELRKRRVWRGRTYIWALSVLLLTSALIYWEQTALLFVLSTLAMCVLLVVVAIADLVLPVPQAIEAGNYGSQGVRDARFGGNLRQIFAVRRRRNEACPPLLFEPEQRRQEDEVARLAKVPLSRLLLGGGQGFSSGWRQRPGGRSTAPPPAATGRARRARCGRRAAVAGGGRRRPCGNSRAW